MRIRRTLGWIAAAAGAYYVYKNYIAPDVATVDATSTPVVTT